MKKHTIAAVPGGFICGFITHDGALCAVSDHGSRASAQAEANRLNTAELIRHQREALRAIAADTVRRPVRYFEQDAFA